MNTELFLYTLLVNRVIGDTFEFYCPEYGFWRLHDTKWKLQQKQHIHTFFHCKCSRNGGSEKVCESVYPALLFWAPLTESIIES